MLEIERFEKWITDVTPSLGNPDYEPTIEEKRLACRLLGIQAMCHPAGSEKRITVEVSPPGIIKALEPLVKVTRRGC